MCHVVYSDSARNYSVIEPNWQVPAGYRIVFSGSWDACWAYIKSARGF